VFDYIPFTVFTHTHNGDDTLPISNTEHINTLHTHGSCKLSLQFPVQHLHALQDEPILHDIKWTLPTQKVQIPYILESDPHPFLHFQRAKKSDAD
jgi:hypothetical protein